MSNRKPLVSTIRFAFLLASLAWLPAEAASTPAPESPVAYPDGIHCHHGRLVAQPGPCLFRPLSTSDVLRAYDRIVDPEEQDGTEVEKLNRPDADQEPQPAFLIPSGYHKSFERQTFAPPTATSPYPLRC